MTCTEWTLPGQKGVTLFARSWLPEGNPRDTVVLSHGYAEHCGRYANLVDRLVPLGYAVHALDHRGHGRSGGRPGIVDRLDHVIADLHGFIAQVRQRHGGGPVKLLGHSMGGLIAFRYAHRHQRDLSGLVLSGPAIGGSVLGAQRMILRLLSAVAPAMGVMPLPAEGVSRDPAVVKAYVEDPLVHHGKVPARTAGELVGGAVGNVERAPQITVPVLIQHGSADALIAPADNTAVYEAIGAADKTVRIYEGLFHEIYNEPEHPEVIGDLIAWLEAHPRP